MDIRVTKLKKNGVKKRNPLKRPIDVPSYTKLKAILKHELSLFKTLLHTGRDGKEHADRFHEYRWPKTACSHGNE
jgi:hypothetical protein